MIYTVTFNPSLDYVVSVNDFTSGSINRTIDEEIYPGGKGINVSSVLSELGVENTALGFVSGFTGDHLVQLLKEKNVRTDFIRVKNGISRINVKLRSFSHDNETEHHISKEETEINGQGPVVSEEELAQLMCQIHALKEEDVLIISGSVSKGVPENIYAEMVKICNKKHVKVVVDASSALLWNTLEYAPFLIKPNHHELGDLFHCEIDTYEKMIFYAKELKNCGACNVLVSAGKEGAVLVAEDGNVYKMPAPKGKVKNSIGAGDSMVAGFLAEYLFSGNYEKALKLGIAAGSATAFSECLAIRAEIEEVYWKEFS